MRCLTVCAPFAALIVTGAKPVENRSRPTRYRGPVLIHAGLRRSYGGHSADYWATLFGVEPRTLAYGAIIGVVDLVACHEFDAMASLAPTLLPSPHVIGPWC